jgi:4-amino-4-deoxy-L-arabinose transferase
LAIPWAFFLPLAAVEVLKKAAADSLTRYCLCWFVTQFLFFSACGGKLATYILPGFAPLAILVADAILDSRRTRWLRRSALAGIGIFLAAGGFLMPLPWPEGLEEARRILINDSGMWPLALAVLAAALCLGAAAGSFALKRPRLSSVGWIALSICAPALASFHFLPRDMEDNKSPSRLLEAVAPLTPPEALVLVDGSSLPSACWHYRRSDVAFFGGQGELQYGLRFPEGEGRHFSDPKTVSELLSRTLAGARPVAVFARKEVYAALVPHLAGLRPAMARGDYRHVWALFLME